MPHLDLLFVAAYPTSFFTSPTEFAATAIAHGARLFAANCAVCHGVEARGDGPAARSLPLVPADLTADHFRAHSDGELYWFISHGFATPEGTITMPGFAGVLSSEAIWHLIDYLRAHNAGDALRRTGSWPQPLPMPQFDAQCANGQIIDLDDLRGRALRIIAVSDDERPDTSVAGRCRSGNGSRRAQPCGKTDRRGLRRERAGGLDSAGHHRRVVAGCAGGHAGAGRSQRLAARRVAARRCRGLDRSTRSSPRGFATFSPIRLPSIRPRRTRTITDGRRVCPAASSGAPPAVLLRLDHPGLRLLRRVLTPGRRGRHAVDLRRADDARFRLVAHRAVRRRVVGRRAGSAVGADARPHAGSSAAPVSCCASRC